MSIELYLTHLASITGVEQKKFYEWLLKEGRSYKVDMTLSKEILDIRPNLKDMIQVKGCFTNSVRSVMFDPQMTYVEGFYVTTAIGLPFEHAWNLLGEISLDFTAAKHDFEVVEYFGVEIPTDIVLRAHLEADGNAIKYYFKNR